MLAVEQVVTVPASTGSNYSVSQPPTPPPMVFLNFFPNGWEFLINFYTPIIPSFLH